MFLEDEDEELAEDQYMFEMAAMLFELIDRSHYLEVDNKHYKEFKENLKSAAVSLKSLGIERLQEKGMYIVH